MAGRGRGAVSVTPSLRGGRRSSTDEVSERFRIELLQASRAELPPGSISESSESSSSSASPSSRPNSPGEAAGVTIAPPEQNAQYLASPDLPTPNLDGITADLSQL